MDLIQENWIAFIACVISAVSLYLSWLTSKRSKYSELRLRLDALRLRGEQFLQECVNNRRDILHLQTTTKSLQVRLKRAFESQHILSKVYQDRFQGIPESFSSMIVNPEDAVSFEKKLALDGDSFELLFLACEHNYELVKNLCIGLPDVGKESKLKEIHFDDFENTIHEFKCNFELDKAAIINVKQSTIEFEELINNFEIEVLCFEEMLDERIEKEGIDSTVSMMTRRRR